MLTQPSVLCGTVKRVSTFRASSKFITGGQNNLTYKAASHAVPGRFNRIHQVAPMLPSSIANRPLMLRWTHASPCPKRHFGQFSRFCTAHRRYSQTIFTMACPFTVYPLKNANSHRIWTAYNTWFTGPTQSTSQTAPRSVQPFCSPGSRS